MSRFKDVEPIGDLADILEKYDASPNTAKGIARRAGSVVGPAITPGQVEGVILDTMEGDGVPKWDVVFDKLGDAATRTYKGLPPFKKAHRR